MIKKIPMALKSIGGHIICEPIIAKAIRIHVLVQLINLELNGKQLIYYYTQSTRGMVA